MYRSQKMVIAERKKEKIEYCTSIHVMQLRKANYFKEKWTYTIQEYVLWFASCQQVNPTQLLSHSPAVGLRRELES